jgi:hypothetical protein
MKLRIAVLFGVALVSLAACANSAPAAPSRPPSLSDQHTTAIDGVTWACDGSVLIYFSGHGISAVPGDPRCKA